MNTPPKDVENIIQDFREQRWLPYLAELEEFGDDRIMKALHPILEADQNRIEHFIRQALTTYTEQRVREEREKQNGEWVLQLEDWIERLENLKKYLKDNE